MQEGFDAGNVTSLQAMSSRAKSRDLGLIVISGLLVGAGAFLIDRLIKVWVMQGTIRQGPVFFSWMEVTRHQNSGLLGDWPLPGWLIVILSAAALGLLGYGLYEALVHERGWDLVALCLVLGGALGNLYDRLAYGYVFDWLMFFKTSIVNGADIMITVGLVVYVALHLRKKPNMDVDCQVQPTNANHIS